MSPPPAQATSAKSVLFGDFSAYRGPAPVALSTRIASNGFLTLHREDPYLQFSQATEKAGTVRTLESLARIELGAQGGALVERVNTTRTAKDGTATMSSGAWWI